MISLNTLNELCQNCASLMSYAEITENDNDKSSMYSNFSTLREICRKLLIAEVMEKRKIICVCGFQSVGKTTLMKNYYKIPDGIMKIDNSRSEKLPVLITEKAGVSKDAPKMYGWYFKKNDTGYEQKKRELDASQFKEASSGSLNVDGETLDFIYLELEVAHMHTYSEAYSYMLLPGFERKNDYWQDLIDFSLKCGSAAVFVLEKHTLATEANKTEMEKRKKEFGEKMIYVITHSDGTTDDNKEAKDNLIAEMKLEAYEDKVICSGIYSDKNKNKAWEDAMEKAIEKYITADTNYQKANYVYNIIVNDIKPIISELKQHFTDEKMEAVADKLENNEDLKAFDSVKAKRRKIIVKKLDEKMKESISKSQNSLNNIIKSEETNIFTEVGGALKRKIFGPKPKDIVEKNEKFLKKLDASLKDSSGTYYYHTAFIETVKESCNTIEDANKKRFDKLLLADKNKNKAAQPPVVVENNSKSLALTQNNEREKAQLQILQDVGFYLKDENEKDYRPVKLTNRKEALQVIADMGTLYFAEELAGETCPGYIMNNLNINLAELNLDKETAKKEIGEFGVSVLGVLGVTGVDIMSDGIFDTVKVIASALGVASPVAFGLWAGIVGIGLSGALIRENNRILCEDYNASSKAIVTIHNDIKKQLTDCYDDAMNELRDKLEENIIAKLDINRASTKQFNARLAIVNIERIIDKIKEEVMDSGYDITGLLKS
ncbi:MAG: hypothetical protein LUG66_05770 [Clostridiales bacterium]|nr:hypothetical protein [Clostridiales bacterium]